MIARIIGVVPSNQSSARNRLSSICLPETRRKIMVSLYFFHQVIRLGIPLLGTLIYAFQARAQSFRTVHLRLKWHHQFQSAGYYMAVHKGFYRAAGLEVIVSEPEQGKDAVNMVLARETEFAVGSSGLVIQRMKGRSVVALAAIFQTSPLLLIVQDQDRFKSPNGLLNSKLMIEPGAEELDVLLSANGLTRKDLNQVAYSNPIASFSQQVVDGFTAYATDEIYTLANARVAYKKLAWTHLGDGFYSDVLFTSQATIDSDPLMVRSFTRASLEGWQYAFDHIDETIALIQEKYGVTRTSDALHFEAKEMLRFSRNGSEAIGSMSGSKWSKIAEAFATAKLAPQCTSLDGFVYGESFRSRNGVYVVPVAGSLLIVSLAGFSALIHALSKSD